MESSINNCGVFSSPSVNIERDGVFSVSKNYILNEKPKTKKCLTRVCYILNFSYHAKMSLMSNKMLKKENYDNAKVKSGIIVTEFNKSEFSYSHEYYFTSRSEALLVERAFTWPFEIT